jgi:DNA-binding MarR family transcriptional regulator
MNQDDSAQEMLDWLSGLTRRSLHAALRFTRESGLTLLQMYVLQHLFYQGPVEISRLTGTLGVSIAAAGQMVERMVQQGLLLRVEIPGDRRAHQVHLSDAGRALVEGSVAERRAWLEQVCARLTAEQRTDLVEALRLMEQTAQAIDTPSELPH